jgi:hypothetical protein
MPCDCAPECNGLSGEECRRCCIIYNDGTKAGTGGLLAMRREVASWPENEHTASALEALDEAVISLQAMDEK